MAGKYQVYPEYKNSGVKFLGEIPVDWEIMQLKRTVDGCVNGIWGTEPKKDGNDTIVLRVADFDRAKLSIQEDGYTYRRIEEKEKPMRKLNSGDLLLEKSGGGEKTLVGQVVLFNKGFEAVTSNFVAKMTPNSGFDSRFLNYVFSRFYSENINYCSIKQNTGIQNLDSASYLVEKFGFPQEGEQQKIANFLDHETAKIDTLIEKQQQLIKLLKEKHQAVISHAVTKGLSSLKGSQCPMRDSGVEWLGEVPEHWTVRRLKHTAKLQSGIPKGKDLTDKVSISVPMLRVANVQDGYLNLDVIHNIDIEPEQLERYLLKDGDVLMNEGGDNDKLGRGAVWKSEIEICIHQNHVFAIRPTFIEPEWLDLLTRTSYAKFHFFRVAKQSTNLASISSTNIKETPLVIPPEKERREIMEYVLNKIDTFTKVEEKCSLQITLLQERRTALISAAVTGKIDVRNRVAPAHPCAHDISASLHVTTPESSNQQSDNREVTT